MTALEFKVLESAIAQGCKYARYGAECKQHKANPVTGSRHQQLLYLYVYTGWFWLEQPYLNSLEQRMRWAHYTFM